MSRFGPKESTRSANGVKRPYRNPLGNGQQMVVLLARVAVGTEAGQKRGASAPPGKGYATDDKEDSTGPQEETQVQWRVLPPLQEDEGFLFPD